MTISQPISDQRGNNLQETMLKTLLNDVKTFHEEIRQLEGIVRNLEKTDVTKTLVHQDIQTEDCEENGDDEEIMDIAKSEAMESRLPSEDEVTDEDKENVPYFLAN